MFGRIWQIKPFSVIFFFYINLFFTGTFSVFQKMYQHTTLACSLCRSSIGLREDVLQLKNTFSGLSSRFKYKDSHQWPSWVLHNGLWESTLLAQNRNIWYDSNSLNKKMFKKYVKCYINFEREKYQVKYLPGGCPTCPPMTGLLLSQLLKKGGKKSVAGTPY